MLRRFTSSLSTCALGMVFGWSLAEPATAAPPETAPGELVQIIDQIEAASDAKNIETVLAAYSQSFATADGFNRAQLEQTLRQFWEQYSALDYEIELVSWEPAAGGFAVETVTRIIGTQARPERELTLNAEVRSRQRFEGGQIVYQEILTERSRLTAGSNPPSLNIMLPEQVEPGARYGFDAIVQEPLGNRSLLGVALDEGVTAEDFLAPRPLTLENLNAGGLFKIGQATEQPDSRWVSAVIVREDGMTVETRRLRVD